MQTQPLVAAQVLLQPFPHADVQATTNNHTNAVVASDLQVVLGLPQRNAATTCAIETSQPTAHQVDTTPLIPTISECSTNNQQFIPLHQGSADTQATEYIPVQTQPTIEAPSCSSDSISKPEGTNKEQTSPYLGNP